MSPVLYPWLLIVIVLVSISTADAPKFNGFTKVLRVVSSNSIWYDVVMPGVTDIDTRSFASKLWASLQTTVPTTFSTKPVISVFVGFTLFIFLGLDSISKYNVTKFLEKTKKFHVLVY